MPAAAAVAAANLMQLPGTWPRRAPPAGIVAVKQTSTAATATAANLKQTASGAGGEGREDGGSTLLAVAVASSCGEDWSASGRAVFSACSEAVSHNKGPETKRCMPLHCLIMFATGLEGGIRPVRLCNILSRSKIPVHGSVITYITFTEILHTSIPISISLLRIITSLSRHYSSSLHIDTVNLVLLLPIVMTVMSVITEYYSCYYIIITYPYHGSIITYYHSNNGVIITYYYYVYNR